MIKGAKGYSNVEYPFVFVGTAFMLSVE